MNRMYFYILLALSKTRNAFMIASFLVLANTAYAVEWTAPTTAELALLPPFCEAKLNNNSPNKAQWSRTLGRIFQSIHHYCFALNFVNRSYGMTGKDRGSTLHFALDNYNYMLKDPSNTHWLIPEILVNRGIALKLSGRDADALKDFYSALKLNPKYALAYAKIAEHFVAIGDKKNALEVVSQGLRYLPDAKFLQRRYRELGGALPYPEPLADNVEDTQTKVEAEDAAVDNPQTERSDRKPDEPDAADSADDEIVETPIGTKKNPWCRFCTE